ncbi:VOC family protein [Falsihalocynthiibacter sp. S25ZX9]|uniref:VOC family protein n=1 Tax=unclassified Falsihalocynthiibacter TaxID=2854191 RepID=UPI00350EC733
MELGAFSVSLNVKDIQVSLAFYEKLGFEIFHGDVAQGWLILQLGTTTIGLFQGMFPRNILTFNPGWDSQAKPLDDFDDVRVLQKAFAERGLDAGQPIDPDSQGPASFMIVDPDGNPILIDQHV